MGASTRVRRRREGGKGGGGRRGGLCRGEGTNRSISMFRVMLCLPLATRGKEERVRLGRRGQLASKKGPTTTTLTPTPTSTNEMEIRLSVMSN